MPGMSSPLSDSFPGRFIPLGPALRTVVHGSRVIICYLFNLLNAWTVCELISLSILRQHFKVAIDKLLLKADPKAYISIILCKLPNIQGVCAVPIVLRFAVIIRAHCITLGPLFVVL